MRSALLLPLGLTLVLATTARPADEKDVPPPEDSYVKVRIEVEVRGILRVTEKGATVAARYRLYDVFDDAKEITDPARRMVSTLDFARAKDLREVAKALNGKEVVVTGMSELREVVHWGRPGGGTGPGGSAQPPSAPTWSLQRTVLVTGLKSAGEK